jgi:hypothetical protein
MIPRGLEPIDLAASMTPPSTSERALSICLEKKGIVPKTRGRIAPFVPIAVPTTKRVSGIRAARSMIKGIDLKKLIILSNIVNTGWFARIPDGAVVTRSTPKKMPKQNEIEPEIPTMVRV